MERASSVALAKAETRIAASDDDRAQDDRRAEALAEDVDVHQTLVACREMRPCGRSRKIAITPR